MSEPITLYRMTERGESGVQEGFPVLPVGKFVGRAWCATHNLPMDGEITGDGYCYYYHADAGLPPTIDCALEPLPRLVQEPPQ
jgi:hypothetical protein